MESNKQPNKIYNKHLHIVKLLFRILETKSQSNVANVSIGFKNK